MAKEDKKVRNGKWGYFGKMVGINLFIIAALTAILLGCLSMWLGSYTRHSDRIEMPSLQGVPTDEAIQYLEHVGLKAMVIDSIYANVRPGSVVEQLPAAGLPVKEGRIVYLTVSRKGIRMVKAQDVLNGSRRDAVSTLRQLGFVVDSIRQVPSDMDELVLSATVRGEEMVPGQEYPLGTRVVLHVGCSGLEIEPENEETEEGWME